MHNDFEELINQKYPEILKKKNELLEKGYKRVQLSGSGGALFAIK